MELNNTQIQEILPHRYPFLLVDKIVECEPGQYAKGIKCVSANEMHFMGHFPGHPVMPGVLIIEAMAQTGAVVALTMEENKGKLVFFGGINKARFRKQVEPGDVLEMEVTMSKYKYPVGIATAVAKVGDEVACTAEFTFAIGDAQ